MASDDCIRFGHRRGSCDYKKCMEKKLELKKIDYSFDSISKIKIKQQKSTRVLSTRRSIFTGDLKCDSA